MCSCLLSSSSLPLSLPTVKFCSDRDTASTTPTAPLTATPPATPPATFSAAPLLLPSCHYPSWTLPVRHHRRQLIRKAQLCLASPALFYHSTYCFIAPSWPLRHNFQTGTYLPTASAIPILAAVTPTAVTPTASTPSVPTSTATMAGLFRSLYGWLLKRFWASELDVTMVGLQNAGKTSLLMVLSGTEYTFDSIPTIGFNLKHVQRGHVTLKCWDIGGQLRFRRMWERYCRGVDAIVFIIDLADYELLPSAKEELHLLMQQPTLVGIPLLVLGNKSDLPKTMSCLDLIDYMDLKLIDRREVACYTISTREETNLDSVISWLVKPRPPVQAVLA